MHVYTYAKQNNYNINKISLVKLARSQNIYYGLRKAEKMKQTCNRVSPHINHNPYN